MAGEAGGGWAAAPSAGVGGGWGCDLGRSGLDLPEASTVGGGAVRAAPGTGRRGSLRGAAGTALRPQHRSAPTAQPHPPPVGEPAGRDRASAQRTTAGTDAPALCQDAAHGSEHQLLLSVGAGAGG